AHGTAGAAGWPPRPWWKCSPSVLHSRAAKENVMQLVVGLQLARSTQLVDVGDQVPQHVEPVVVLVHRDFLERLPVLPFGPDVAVEFLLRAVRLLQGRPRLVSLVQRVPQDDQPRLPVAGRLEPLLDGLEAR